MTHFLGKRGALGVQRALGSLAVVALLLAGCAAEVPTRLDAQQSPGSELVRRMTFAPLELRIPRIGREVERRVLPNGIVLYLADDRSLPLLQAFAVFRAGSLFEDPAHPASARFTASQLRSGGTETLPFAKLNEELEFLGASIEASASLEEITVSLSALAKDADRALQIFSDIIRRPAFDPTPLKIAKGQAVEDLRRLVDNPGRLASREFNRSLYTDAHPLGRPLTTGQVAALERADLVRHHGRFFYPNNMFLALVGDFSREQLVTKALVAFGDWAREPAFALPPVPPVTPRIEQGVRVLPRDIAQASVILGHFGTTRENPDRHAIELMDFILGSSGFNSRLMDRLRTSEGMTYGAWSSFPTGSNVLGLFRAGLQTKNENVPRAVAGILEEMRRLQVEPVTAAELDRAKEAIINSFIFRFTSRYGTVTRLLMLEVDGEPAGYYDTLLDRYRQVTPADIQRAARQYLHPDHSVVLVVGAAKAFEAALAPFGPVRQIPLDPL
ncbi:MAG: insulinase family protein [candidate division NC10 bacterium]|nr:insulinase family protein [candidate division NC10 bacterium]